MPTLLQLLDRDLKFVVGKICDDLSGDVEYLLVGKLLQPVHDIPCLAGKRFI